ncbi:putative bifunctional diguanylate cyclase/phosphodiesterase [Actinospica robiniae]|uniref:putative bifunctional diguanylate cyclase/phosphodiesterase n=1 Tax=Actinospica robiniae TaxID=304901 RepID=UPI0006856AB2|nr:EAL domain-containing protein [Actinospica robiniae]
MTSRPSRTDPIASTARPDRVLRGLVAAFLVISAAAFGCYELLPAGQMASWAVLGIAALAAVVVGVMRHKPDPALPWVLLGVSLAIEIIADLVYQSLGGSIGGDGPFPSAADAIYVAVYPVMIYALLGFVRRDPPEYSRGTLLDVLIVAVGFGALSWGVFSVPVTPLPQLSVLAMTILFAYLLGDPLVFALTLQLPLSGRLRSWPVWLLLLGALGSLYSDTYFALTELHPDWPSAPGEIIGYAAFYITWGLAALLPAMAKVVQPPAGRPWALVAPRTWIALLCCAALISPVLLLVNAYRSTPRDTQVLVGCCITIFLLVFARLVQAMRAWQRTSLRREAQAYLHTLIADAQDSIIVASPRGEVRFSSHSAQRLFGARLGRGPVSGLFTGGDRDRVAHCFDELDDDPHAAPRWPTAVHVRSADERIVRAEARWSDLREDPAVRGIALTLRDVTEERRLEDELRKQALTDPLTGLMNRQALQLLMLRDQNAAAEDPGAGGLLMIDLDDFKEVNDTLGHPIGDEVLVAFAGRILEHVRAEDAVARLGGDEFAVLMAHRSDPSMLEAVAQRLGEAFDEPLETSAGPLRVAASLGLVAFGPAAYPETPDEAQAQEADRDTDPDALMRAADLAMYAAKAEGKHRWRRYHAGLLDQAVRRSELRAALDETLAQGALAVWYQPIVHLDTRQVFGFEALVRWPHPTLGLLGPDVFIPLAEETGQILELGRQVLRIAAKQAVAWSALRPVPGCSINVNVSVRQLREEGFVEAVRDVVAEVGIEPRHLVLEVTETALLDHDDVEVRERLQHLRDLGVAIALDDFGTGYASLISLHDMPIDIIKVDKSFTSRLTTSDRMRRLVRGLLAIGEAMGIHTMAEGVESWEQHEQLLALGTRAGQGFLYGRPLTPADASTVWVAHRPLPVEDPRTSPDA